ncbi:MAG: sigma 54-interacting transcriptional regulator [Acidobacteria bacterium]|nr:sigma 54-interacting transcriptional regulator [Acidobacteriota bacterium]
MPPRLIALDGPLKGAVFPLDEDEITIGRDQSNRLVIGEDSVSPHHCRIRREGDDFRLIDLEGPCGTFVNNVPVREHLMEQADQVEIGNSQFLFLRRDDDPKSAGVLEPPAAQPAARILPKESPLGARELSALMRISMGIHSIQALYSSSNLPVQEALERQLLELITEVVPAERGAIFLLDEGRSAAIPAVEIPRDLLDRVVRGASPVLGSETRAAARCWFLAVPLVTSGKVFGVIYLDTRNPAAPLDDSHLLLMTAIAGIGAMALENARYVEWLEVENRRLRTEGSFQHNLIGESSALRKVCEVIARVAPTGSTVLICGESGTGKELAARAIHLNSPRAAKPFVAINCAALAPTLLESELFGHEKGSFTGAIAQKRGKLESAEGGTLFLDEVTELPPPLQVKLLRVLQEREFERVGGGRSIKVDLRVLASTNRDAEEAVRSGVLRADLYHRLNVVMLEMPPLRDRRQDIPLLASYFAAQCGKRMKRIIRGVSPEARSCLLHYDWPGNVRELENAIERAVVLGSSDFILPEDLPEAVWENSPAAAAPAAGRYHQELAGAKKKLLLEALDQAGGSYTEAAKLLGLHPNYLHRLVRNLKLKAASKGA